MYSPKQLSAIEQQRCTGNHLGCRLWFTRGDPAADVPPSSDSQQLYEHCLLYTSVNVDGATTMHIDTDESEAAGNPTVGEIYR